MKSPWDGKELQDELGLGWYDYGFRFYDPEKARFVSVDPLAESQSAFTPYHYTYNNTILFVDSSGLASFKIAARDFLGSGGRNSNNNLLGGQSLFIEYLAHIGAHEIYHTMRYRAYKWDCYSDSEAKSIAIGHLGGPSLAQDGYYSEDAFFPSSTIATKENRQKVNQIPAEERALILFYYGKK
ncbi:MAG: RHS repeat-associated core domain-containing protein [Bacteroidia bacterium]